MGDIVAEQGVQAIRLELERPEPGTVLSPNGRVSGFGWIASETTLQGLTIHLNEHGLCRATVGLSRTEIIRIYGRCPDGPGVGFIFTGTVPVLPAGPATLRVVAQTAAGQHVHAVPVSIAPNEGVRTPDPAAPRAPASTPARPPAPQAIRAVIEEARVNEQGVLRVSGWVVSLSEIKAVRVVLAGKEIGTAQRNISRKDVAAAHPLYPNGENSGFLFQYEVPDGLVGEHIARVIVEAVGGIRRELTAPFTISEATRRRPRQKIVHFFCDEISLTSDGTFAVNGWAVCPAGVAAIDVDVGDVPAGRAVIGGDRPDVGNAFPEIPSARKAGFRLETKLSGTFEGEQIAALTVLGEDGQTHTILQPVAVRQVAPRGSAAAVSQAAETQAGAAPSAERLKYYLDTPDVRDGRALEPIRGFMSLAGWAFARAGIAGIEVFVDDVSLGSAYHGIRREDLQDAFPGWDALLSGFAMLIPPQVMRKGSHKVRLLIRDKNDYHEEIAFEVEAEPASEGPGPWRLREKMTQAEIDQQTAFLDAAGHSPRWSLLMPLQSFPAETIAAARTTIGSLRHQAYTDWHLTIGVVAADADRKMEITALEAEVLAGFSDLAPRIGVRVCNPDELIADLHEPSADNGLIAIVAPGDMLGEDALLEMSLEGTARVAPDFIYGDERRVDPGDGDLKAFFKPDWSPDLLLATNYIGRLWAATPNLLRVSGLTFGDIAERDEYDAVLRVTEHAAKVAHVPKVLSQRDAQDDSDPARDVRALDRATKRRGIAGEILAGCIPGTYRIRRSIRTDAMISIIIPTIASRGLIRTTVESIRAKTNWQNYEIICLDNIPVSDNPEKAFWKAWMKENADRVVEIGESFNWSRFNNIGARAARGKILLFLNDDIEVLDGDWLHGLVEHVQREEVGVVGPQLLYPDGRVQHAGMFLSDRVARHAFRFAPRDEPGPFGLARTERNVISVTGACLMVRRSLFDDLGGFDEAHAVINNDLDFCLRAGRSGHTVIYTPHVSLVHHEMVSRSKLRDVYNESRFDDAWRDLFLTGDPYFNRHLTTDSDDYVPDSEPLRVFQAGHPLIARDKVRRILAVKVDHIGDFITAFPAFRRIKEHFPNAELHVLAAKASLSLAALEPAIDHIIEFNFFHARSESGRREESDEELEALRDSLAPYRYDIAIDLRRQPDTREILKFTDARWLAGFDREYKMSWLDIAVEWEGDFARHLKRSHAVESLTQLVDAVALACEGDRTMVSHPISMEDARAAISKIPAVAQIASALFSRTVVSVHTGAGALNKQWPAPYFAGLIDLLIGVEDVNVVIVGGPDEAEFAQIVMDGIRRSDRVFSLVGKTSLRDLPNVLRSCDLYVGNDSGPKHMAASLGVPTIGIHSGSVDAGEWGPMGPHTMTIRRDMTCSPCYLARASDCHRGLACLHGIKVGDVFRACQRMLTLSSGTRHARNLSGRTETVYEAAEN